MAEPSASEIREKYDRMAKWYDALIPLEWLGLGAIRRELLSKARGNVIEIAAGTGRNFRYYPPDTRVTAIDLSPAMLAIARQRAKPNVRLAVMNAEALGFAAASFDTVISTLGLCTYPHPEAALREMARVCRPAGRILLIEHGRSNRPRIARFQDRHAAFHVSATCCHWNREPLELVHQAGLRVIASRRRLFGVVHIIESGGGG
jgi:ubiquinone/menaquinone biosynthesis C-methylase UbiE